MPPALKITRTDNETYIRAESAGDSKGYRHPSHSQGKCPWDRKQTNESLRPNTIEEVYELCDALINDDSENIRKELGDVLLHVLFYAKIGEEQGTV